MRFEISKFKLLFMCALLLAPCTAWAAVSGPPSSPAPAIGNAPQSGQIPIRQIDVEGLYSIKKSELIYMLCLNSAKTIIPVHLRRGIKRAFKKGIFEYIEVDSDDARPGRIIVKVREKDVIGKISFKISGRAPKKFLSAHLPFKAGAFMRYALINGASASLQDALSQYGYPDASVNIGVQREKSRNPYLVDLNITVNEGQATVIRGLKIIGHGGPEAARALDIKPCDRYDQYTIRARLEKLRQNYREEGYLNPLTGPFAMTNGILYVSVEPGVRYQASFTGNSAVSTKKLRKALPFEDAGEARNDLVDEAVQRMKALYNQKGLPGAQIAPVFSEHDGLYRIHFFISEGEKVKVRSIKFTGTNIDASRLKTLLSLREGGLYNPDLLDKDKSQIADLLNSLGYIDAKVSDPEVAPAGKGKVDITFNISKGAQYRIAGLKVEGASAQFASQAQAALRIKPGDIYNEYDVTTARYRILSIYNNAGYADCQVGITREFRNDGAYIDYKITEGHKLYFGKSVVIGNKNTKLWVIRRELAHKDGSPFSYNTLLTEKQHLYELGIFNSVDTEIIGRHGDTVDVAYKVSEGKPGAVEFGAGYGDYEKERGFAQLSYNNLFGRDMAGSLRFEGSTMERRAILNFSEPWFLGAKQPFRAFLLAENRTEKNFDTGEVIYKLTRYTASAGVERKLGARVKGQLYYDFTWVNTYDVAPDAIITREDVGTRAISGISPALFFDSRDDPFNPKTGIFAGASLKYATPFLLSQSNFIKAVAQSSEYLDLSRLFVLAMDEKIGMAKGIGNTSELPIVERFFLGGRNSVRGYAQDTLGPKGLDGTPLGGNAFLQGNVELRTAITKTIGIAPFLDMGNVWPNVFNMNLTSLKFTTGLSFRITTPVGPLRLDYGVKLSRQPGESVGELHFSIGNAF